MHAYSYHSISHKCTELVLVGSFLNSFLTYLTLQWVQQNTKKKNLHNIEVRAIDGHRYTTNMLLMNDHMIFTYLSMPRMEPPCLLVSEPLLQLYVGLAHLLWPCWLQREHRYGFLLVQILLICLSRDRPRCHLISSASTHTSSFLSHSSSSFVSSSRTKSFGPHSQSRSLLVASGSKMPYPSTTTPIFICSQFHHGVPLIRVVCTMSSMNLYTLILYHQ